MGSEIRKPDHLKSGQMAAIFQNPFEIQTKKVRISKVSGFKMVGFQIHTVKWEIHQGTNSTSLGL